MDKVVHFEIPADDLARAEKFYGEVFGWQIQSMPEMNYTIARTAEVDEKMMIKEPGAINGGMLKRNAVVTVPGITIQVASIDEAIKKVLAGGGQVVKEKVAVGNMGFIAYFKDSESNVLSMWENIASGSH